MDAGFTVRLIVASIFIAVVLFALRWLLPLATRNGANSAAGRLLDVVESKPLAPNTVVHVVRVADRFFLLGGGNGHVEMLAELDAATVESQIARRPAPVSLGRSPLVEWIAGRARR